MLFDSLSYVTYLAKLWKQTEGYRNHQAKDNGSTNVSNRSSYHWVPLDKFCPEMKMHKYLVNESLIEIPTEMSSTDCNTS